MAATKPKKYTPVADKAIRAVVKKLRPKPEPLLGRYGTLPYTPNPDKKKREKMEFKHAPHEYPDDETRYNYKLDYHPISTGAPKTMERKKSTADLQYKAPAWLEKALADPATKQDKSFRQSVKDWIETKRKLGKKFTSMKDRGGSGQAHRDKLLKEID